jgi:hypothetical protein
MIDESKFESLGIVCSAAGITDLSWYYGLPRPKMNAVDRQANLMAIASGNHLKDLGLAALRIVVDSVRRSHGV